MNTIITSFAAVTVFVSGIFFWMSQTSENDPITSPDNQQQTNRETTIPEPIHSVKPAEQTTPIRESNTADTQQSEPVPIRVETVATGLEVPWSIAWTGPNRMLVTERPGRVRVIENGSLREAPLHVFSEVVSAKGNETGLMGLAVDPAYDQNRFLYFSMTSGSGENIKVKISRFRDEGDRLADEKILLDDIPAAKYHVGNRIAFGPDGKLYITTGDALQKHEAQEIDSLAGKILRINSDGTLPADNPFEQNPVWSYGHRNAQGITWHPQNNNLYQTEHGPSGFDGPPGGDEINRIVKGENYGWPLVSHQNTSPQTKDPLITFTPAEAPASAAFYSGNTIPQFGDCLFFGALRGKALVCAKIDAKNPDVILDTFPIAAVDFGRIRPVAMGPDGNLYFATSNRDGRGDPAAEDDRLLRIVPENKE